MDFIFGGIFLFWGLLGGAPSAAAGAACPTVDLRSAFPLEIRNQGDLSWCYAHTGADYLQFHFRISEQISAADIAIEYGQRFWPKMVQFFKGDEIRQFGLLRPALRDALETGYCPESAFPSYEWKRVLTASGLAERHPIADSIRELSSLHRGVLRGEYRAPPELPFWFEFPGVGEDRFFNVLSQSDPGDLLRNLRNAACEGYRRPYPGEVSRISMRFKSSRAFDSIRRNLEAGRPVSIDYFDQVLETPGRFERKVSQLHTSLLMGQRWNPAKNECQYLVKNSYGESCEGYDPGLSCEHGHLWVGESSLRRALVSYVFIRP